MNLTSVESSLNAIGIVRIPQGALFDPEQLGDDPPFESRSSEEAADHGSRQPA